MQRTRISRLAESRVHVSTMEAIAEYTRSSHQNGACIGQEIVTGSRHARRKAVVRESGSDSVPLGGESMSSGEAEKEGEAIDVDGHGYMERLARGVWDNGEDVVSPATMIAVPLESLDLGAVLEMSRANEAVINTIPTLIWSARPEGYVEFLNRRWVEYTGLSAEPALDWGWTAAIHPDDRGGFVEHWRMILASGEPGEIEARLRRWDGEFDAERNAVKGDEARR